MRSRRSIRVLPVLSLLSLMAWSCNLARSDKSENTLSFTRFADSLKVYDEVTLVLKTLDGRVLDTLYQGKVEKVEDVQKLPAPHWDGSRVMVAITGIKDGKVVYQVETRYNPETGTRDSALVYVVPGIHLTCPVRNLTLLVGDSISLPAVTAHPGNLMDKALEWKVEPETLVTLGSDYALASRAGNGSLSVGLKTHPGVERLSIPFSISARGTQVVPESLSIEPESLEVAADGPLGQLSVRISPTNASSAVYWTSADTNVATVDTSGRVQGRQQGKTTILAVSRFRPKAQDFAHVEVTGPIPVTSVKFAKETLDILVGGGAESLLVSVEPPKADPKVVFRLTDSTKATVKDGRISGKEAGELAVIATSVANPLAKDTLIVRASPPVPDDTVPPGQPKVRSVLASPTRMRRPLWSWTSGGGGSGNYQVSLDNPVFDSAATSVSETLYQPSVDLDAGVHVLYVRERDASENWSLPGSAQVEVDFIGPEAPKLVGTSPTRSMPRWTWSTGGGGGAGRFRYRMGNADFLGSDSGTADTAFALTSASNGTTYTLYVQERDATGNFSPSANLSIKYDLTQPTVTLSVPQASGTFITAKDTATVSGSVSGPNGIAKVEYAVDAGAATTIPVGTGGTWKIAALPLANARTTSLKITATDSAGNKGESGLSILRDSDPPAPPASLSAPASPTNVAAASWTWSAAGDGPAGSGLNGKYRWKLNAGAWIEVAAAAATGVALAEGTNTFSVQEQDKAGLWSASVSDTLVLDTKPPDAVVFTGTDSSVAATLTPTWTWAPSVTNGGSGSFLLKLDNGAEFTSSARTYTPTTPLADHAVHTLTVREKDQVPGVVGAAKSFRYHVRVGLDPSKPWGGLQNPPVKTSGCGRTTTVASGKATITSGGQARSFIIDVPAGYDMNRPYRLFYCSHWLNGTSENVVANDYFGLRSLAAAANAPAIFIAPQGMGTGGGWSTTSDIDLVLFDDLLAFAKANLCLDSTRVFATGFSMGGMMTYSLSATRQQHIRAAVAISGTNSGTWLPTPIPTAPIAWMQTHGVSDAVIAWPGSSTRGPRSMAAQRGADNGCAVPDPIPQWQSGNHLCHDFSGCEAEFPTRLCTFNGGHVDVHKDPGSAVNWIAEESWNFFEQF